MEEQHLDEYATREPADQSSSRAAAEINDPILEEMVRVCDAWAEKVTLVDSELQRGRSVEEDIAQCLQRQVLDGLIRPEEAQELRSVSEAWRRLRSAYACKLIGAVHSDREVIENLLDLFASAQITRSFALRVLLDLCRQQR